ncbi:hypothetical protein C0T31_05000 [Dysgonamonadaceae bacterium]|nr:hypothetical protein C0T31_05000 [Dysgonamonadaceae bacterium]
MLHYCYRKCCSVVTKNAVREITENAAFLFTVYKRIESFRLNMGYWLKSVKDRGWVRSASMGTRNFTPVG